MVVNSVITLEKVHVAEPALPLGTAEPKQVVVVAIALVVGSAVITLSTSSVVGTDVVTRTAEVAVAKVVHDTDMAVQSQSFFFPNLCVRQVKNPRTAKIVL